MRGTGYDYDQVLHGAGYGGMGVRGTGYEVQGAGYTGYGARGQGSRVRGQGVQRHRYGVQGPKSRVQASGGAGSWGTGVRSHAMGTGTGLPLTPTLTVLFQVGPLRVHRQHLARLVQVQVQPG